MNIESKYLQASIIPWLIAQVNIFSDKRIVGCCIEINIRKNCLSVYRQSQSNGNRTEFLSHRLTSIFKLCKLANDQNFFAYFYKQPASTLYTLHAFHSNKSNLVKCLSDMQMQAIHLHESLNSYEKIFDFEVVGRVENLNKQKLDTPNFIEG